MRMNPEIGCLNKKKNGRVSALRARGEALPELVDMAGERWDEGNTHSLVSL